MRFNRIALFFLLMTLPFSLFSDTYLLSFPRSGNSWTRYVIEGTTNFPTQEKNPLIPINRPILGLGGYNGYLGTPIWKTHSTHEIRKDDILILVVRDIKECICRHLHGESQKNLDTHVDRYCSLLLTYDTHPIDKRLLVYYEDLLTNPRLEVERIATFLNRYDEERIDTFFEEYESHRQRSLELYRQYVGPTITNGETLKYHSNKENFKYAVDRINALLDMKYASIKQAYLTRYTQ